MDTTTWSPGEEGKVVDGRFETLMLLPEKGHGPWCKLHFWQLLRGTIYNQGPNEQKETYLQVARKGYPNLKDFVFRMKREVESKNLLIIYIDLVLKEDERKFIMMKMLSNNLKESDREEFPLDPFHIISYVD